MPMIRMNDFKSEPEDLIRAQVAAAERIIRSGWFVLGPEVEAFEKQWAEASAAKFSIGVANGMDAIELGLRASGIVPGDEIITTPMTAFASTLAIIRAGATPVLADIDETSGLLSPESAARCIGPKTKGILLVHLYGQVRDMPKWLDLCGSHKIQLFEDCAQAHLASADGRTAGNFGPWGAYSFYPTKNLGCIGDGGALNTNSSELDAKVRVLRNYGQSKRYYHPTLGMNSRLDELQAGILMTRLAKLKPFTERRKDISQRYHAEIKNSAIRLLAPPQTRDSHVHHLFVVLTDARERLQQHMKDKGVEALIHYPVPVHKQEPCAEIKRDPNGLKAVERYADRCLSVPIHPQMSDADVKTVIDALNGFK